jgi:coenzyme F420 hydrogenase subunit beta
MSLILDLSAFLGYERKESRGFFGYRKSARAIRMELDKSMKGQRELKKMVLDTGLCTNCGACVNLCPYAVSYKDQTILLDPCEREEGRCYAFCPRTPTDLEVLRRQLFDPGDFTPELGSMKGFYMTRAADPEVRKSSQHGGTVTTLVALALEEGFIDTAVLTEEEEGDFLPRGVAVQRGSDVRKRGKSRFVVSPNLAAFHRAARGSAEKIGIVATPCQALALAKMRLKPFPAKDSHIDKLRLVIGLFCGWALSWRELKRMLGEKFEGRSIMGLDIPPSKHNSMEVQTPEGILEISIDEVLPFVRKACRYCWDMTGEFSDLSVGSGRCPEGWEVARGWNQVIVRTRAGQELLDLARSRGFLEFRDMPGGNLERLKSASLNKKRTGIRNLIQLSGSAQDLVYLDFRDPVLRRIWSNGVMK